jgi:hypothetical protein
MQAPAAINGGAIVAASGSAQLPRIGFKKKNLTPWTLAPNYRKTMSASRVKRYITENLQLLLKNCYTDF